MVRQNSFAFFYKNKNLGPKYWVLYEVNCTKPGNNLHDQLRGSKVPRSSKNCASQSIHWTGEGYFKTSNKNLKCLNDNFVNNGLTQKINLIA